MVNVSRLVCLANSSKPVFDAFCPHTWVCYFVMKKCHSKTRESLMPYPFPIGGAQRLEEVSKCMQSSLTGYDNFGCLGTHAGTEKTDYHCTSANNSSISIACLQKYINWLQYGSMTQFAAKFLPCPVYCMTASKIMV